MLQPFGLTMITSYIETKCVLCGKAIKSIRTSANKKGKCRRRCKGIISDSGGYPLDPVLRKEYSIKVSNKKAERVERRKLRKTRIKKRTPKVYFYESREWQDLRYRILKKYSRKCMVCFSTNIELHVDHIKPISKFPDLALEESNLQVLCRACNLGKSNKDCIDWRPPNESIS